MGEQEGSREGQREALKEQMKNLEEKRTIITNIMEAVDGQGA